MLFAKFCNFVRVAFSNFNPCTFTRSKCMWIAHWVIHSLCVSPCMCVWSQILPIYSCLVDVSHMQKNSPWQNNKEISSWLLRKSETKRKSKIEKLVVCHWIDCVCVFECVLHQSGSGTFHNNQMKIISSLPGACNKIGWFGAMCIGKKSTLSRLRSDRFKQNVDMCKCMCLNSNTAAPAAAAAAAVSRDRTYMSESMSDMCGKCVLKPINFQHKTEFSIYSHRMKR